MMTQQELDIARVEAKLKVVELVRQWQKDFLGKRMKNASPNNPKRANTNPYA